VQRILIVGGGYAGFYTAFKLEKLLRKGEAEVTMVDPLPYMTYQPFLPEVAAGSIEPRHAVVLHRRHLKKTRVITAKVTGFDHAAKTATITPADGEPWEEAYDQIIVTAGAVSRTFPIPGVADEAIGLKTIEEAQSIRDRLTDNYDKAANLPAGPERARLLTTVVVGGGFAGIEIFAELRSFASSLVKRYPTIDFDETQFHLIEAMGRIMPEVSLKTSLWVIKNLAQRGAEIHLETQLSSAVDGKIELSTGESFESDLIIWTAGVMANPMLKGSTAPLEPRGRMTVKADLRGVDEEGNVIPDLWGAGDACAVPDISGGSPLPDKTCVPNAQHAVRQGKRLAKNIVANLRGEDPKDYFHKPAGAVAGLGVGIGAFQKGKLGITGFPAWVMHRGYHGLAMPMWERKFRVFGDWVGGFFLGRDQLGIIARDTPRASFEAFASRPKPPAPAEEAPAEKPADPGLGKEAEKAEAKADAAAPGTSTRAPRKTAAQKAAEAESK
jgi:NADH:ubiquinone reductase (H+-translocating)